MEEHLNITSLAELMILSNTPYYLFKNFSKEESIKALSDKYSSVSLINALVKYFTIEEKTFEDSVIIYSIVIALMFKPYKEVSEFFRDLDESKITWGNYFKDIFFSKVRSESVFSIEEGYKIQSYNTGNEVATNNTTKLKQEPKIIVVEE